MEKRDAYNRLKLSRQKQKELQAGIYLHDEKIRAYEDKMLEAKERKRRIEYSVAQQRERSSKYLKVWDVKIESMEDGVESTMGRNQVPEQGSSVRMDQDQTPLGLDLEGGEDDGDSVIFIDGLIVEGDRMKGAKCGECRFFFHRGSVSAELNNCNSGQARADR